MDRHDYYDRLVKRLIVYGIGASTIFMSVIAIFFIQ